MDCPNCSTAHVEAARFCARCGTPLHPHADRSRHFAPHPEEPVRALAALSTLLPHLSGGRHHLYRAAVAVLVIAAMGAAAFGVLPAALTLAAIALPSAVLTYVYDHRVWRGEPVTAIVVTTGLPLALGIAVGVLVRHFAAAAVLAAPDHRLPPIPRVLELGVLVPVVGFGALIAAPVLVTARNGLTHPVDAMVACTLSGAAFSLGSSIMVQLGAFSGVDAATNQPANAAFIALTLGFFQPVLFAAAAAVAVLPLRGGPTNFAAGGAAGLALLVAYELATTLLTPYGARGIVLTALVALALSAVGLLVARAELHAALLAEARAALDGTPRAPSTDELCAHCGAALAPRAAFCQVCGTATAALVSHPIPAGAAEPTT